MNRKGFEALADGVMLLIVLLVASTLALSLGGGPEPTSADEAARYAEDTRVALFRTTLDGLTFAQDGRDVVLPNGTSVEAYLRLQVHLKRHAHGVLDFRAANDRIEGITKALVRLGWSYALQGRVADASAAVNLPAGANLPETYVVSSWSYPSLGASGPDTVLSLYVWLSPRR